MIHLKILGSSATGTALVDEPLGEDVWFVCSAIAAAPPGVLSRAALPITRRNMMQFLENRIPPPFMTLIVAAAMWGASFLSAPLALNGIVHYGGVAVFFILAGLFATPAFLAFGRAKTTIDPVHVDRASAMVTTGVYRITRNPMYVGLTSLLLSWAVYLAVPWSFLGPVFFVLFITRFQIIPEEHAMTSKFGDAYADYKRNVRRWF